MRNQGQVVLGTILLILGVMFLFSTLFHIDVGAFCWPVALIVIGVWLIARPRMVGTDVGVTQHLFGDLDRTGAWTVHDEEFWGFVGDIDLDMTAAAIAVGETRLRFFHFVGDIDLFVPADVAVAVSANGFVADVTLLGRKQSGFLTGIETRTDDYESAARKVRVESVSFAGDVKVRRAPAV